MKTFYFFSLVWASSLLLIPAFPTASDLFPADDDMFSQEGIADSDSYSLFDQVSNPGNIPETNLFPAESSSGCLSSSNPPLLRRGLITTRQSEGDACIAPYKAQSDSGSSSAQSLDTTRLGIIGDIQDYWCSEYVAWGFGRVPVCSVVDAGRIPSEEALGEPIILQMSEPSGYINFMNCFLLTPFNSFLCSDKNAYCCNAFLPNPDDPTVGKGFWCMRATRKP